MFGMGNLKAGSRALRPRLARVGRHVRRGAPAYGVLLISLLLTVLAWTYVRQNVEAQSRERFDEATQAVETSIVRRVGRNLDAMYGAAGLLIFNDSLGREEWDHYVKVVSGIEPQRF